MVEGDQIGVFLVEVWGVPLPIFINKKTREPLRDKKVIGQIASIYEKQGSDCWFTDDTKVFWDEYNLTIMKN